MPALRWPDSGVRQDLLQQEHERTRVRIAGPLTSGSLHLCESSGGLMPLMPCPDLVTCQDSGRLSQGSELTRKRDALDYGSRPEERCAGRECVSPCISRWSPDP